MIRGADVQGCLGNNILGKSRLGLRENKGVGRGKASRGAGLRGGINKRRLRVLMGISRSRRLLGAIIGRGLMPWYLAFRNCLFV